MPTKTVATNIEIWYLCGKGLGWASICQQLEAHPNRQGIIVKPCENCLDKNLIEV
jgi:hypothetical protein